MENSLSLHPDNLIILAISPLSRCHCLLRYNRPSLRLQKFLSLQSFEVQIHGVVLLQLAISVIDLGELRAVEGVGVGDGNLRDVLDLLG